MADSTVTLVGNLTRDPEMRFTPNGTGQSQFGLAVNYRRPDRANPGEWQEQTSFFNVICWGSLADNTQSLTKGTRVIVTGRLQQRSWETEQHEKRSVVEIVADEIGPSLRWARVDVHRNERRGPSDDVSRGDMGRGDNGGRATAPAASGGGSGGGSGYDDFGEEPF